MNPPLTPHQSLYYAWRLTRYSAGDSVESFASTLVDAPVDLNPHQVDAALFAWRNPLSRGVLLADEVGLGKAIKAGLVISQHWVERRRKQARSVFENKTDCRTVTLHRQVFGRYHRTADNEGYFSSLATGNGSIEILSYDKLIKDAVRRNRILFDKLGLHKH